MDYYQFTVPPLTGLPNGMTVRFKAAGLSLVLPRVTITDGSGRVVASAASSDPRNNDVTLQFTPSLGGGNYFVKVEGATNDVFGVGGYQLTVDGTTTNAALSPPTAVLEPTLQLRLGDTLTVAVDLLPGGRPGGPAVRRDPPRGDRRHRGRRHLPRPGPGRRRAGAAEPQRDGVGHRRRPARPAGPGVRRRRPAGRVPGAGERGRADERAGPRRAAGPDHYVQVSARDGGGATGGYFFGADFNQFAPTEYDGAAGGALDAGDTTDTGRLSVEAGVFQFALSADLLGAGSGGVTMTVRDAAGNVVVSLSAAAGQPTVTAVRYLAAGNYSVRYDYKTSAGSVAAPVRYGLFLLRLSDGVGPYATSSSTSHGTPSSPPSSTDSGYTYTGNSNQYPDGYGYYY